MRLLLSCAEAKIGTDIPYFVKLSYGFHTLLLTLSIFDRKKSQKSQKNSEKLYSRLTLESFLEAKSSLVLIWNKSNPKARI